jgi:hypothetical protein
MFKLSFFLSIFLFSQAAFGMDEDFLGINLGWQFSAQEVCDYLNIAENCRIKDSIFDRSQLSKDEWARHGWDIEYARKFVWCRILEIESKKSTDKQICLFGFETIIQDTLSGGKVPSFVANLPGRSLEIFYMCCKIRAVQGENFSSDLLIFYNLQKLFYAEFKTNPPAAVVMFEGLGILGDLFDKPVVSRISRMIILSNAAKSKL